jgi:hypothetical protein
LFLLMLGFGYSYFWSASTIIYLLMRRHVDAAEMDEVYLEEDEQEGPYGGHFVPPAPQAPSTAVKPPSPMSMVEPPTLRTPPPAPTPSTAPIASTPPPEPTPPLGPPPTPPIEGEGGTPGM